MIKSSNFNIDEIIAGIKIIIGNANKGNRYSIMANAYKAEIEIDKIAKVLKVDYENSLEQCVVKINQLIDELPPKDKSKAKILITQLKTTKTKNQMDKNYCKNIDLIVVAALYDPELKAFLQLLDDCKEEKIFLPGSTNEIIFYDGLLRDNEKKIKVGALFQDQMGMTDCSALVVNAIHLFQPKVIAMVGVCAGRSEMGVKRNDIIIPSWAFTYETGKHTDKGFKKEPYWCEVNSNIIRRARVNGPNIANSIIDNINKVFPANLQSIDLHFDVMACGSAVVDKQGMINEIGEVHRKVVGLDMESYAFLRSAKITNSSINSIVVKSVMDLASKKDDSYKNQAANLAAQFLSKFVLSVHDLFR